MCDLKKFSGRRPISKKNEENREKGCKNPWELWSDPCGKRLAPELKPSACRAPRKNTVRRGNQSLWWHAAAPSTTEERERETFKKRERDL